MLIKWFRDIEKEDFKFLGEKAVNMVRLQREGLPIPHGFILSEKFYDLFLESAGIKRKILDFISLNINDDELAQEKASEIQEAILDAEMSYMLREAILENYNNMNVNLDIYKVANRSTINMIKAGRDLSYVAVRVSLTDNKTFKNPPAFLNVKGSNNIITAIQRSYASVFTRNFITDIENLRTIKPTLIIQKMVDSKISGIITTDDSSVMIKAALGLSEAIYSNMTTLDYYAIDKNTLQIKDKSVNKQEIILVKDEYTGKTIKKTLTGSMSYTQKISDYDMINLAKISTNIESVLNSRIELEFAIENSRIYLISSRSIKGMNDFNDFNINEKETEREMQPDIVKNEMPVIAPEYVPDTKDVNDYYSGFQGLKEEDQHLIDKDKINRNDIDTKHLPIRISTGTDEFSWTIKHELDWNVVESMLKTLKEKWKQDKL